MRNERAWTLLAGLLAISALSGCTRSLEMTHSPALYRLPEAEKWKGIVLGVAKPEDRRASLQQSDRENLTYVMRQGAWRFGLTYQGREFVPIADLVQTLFVEEFTRAGVESKAIAKILTKDNVREMRDAGELAGVAYVLGGRLLVFEIVNDVGWWTVTSRRSITLEITLVRVEGGAVALDNIVSASDRDESALGVRHSTSVDRLINNVFRQVVTQVVERVAAKLALEPMDVHVRIARISR
jgi:hypothetical protein